MIKVYQDKTVFNDGYGNCMNACIASLLELPLREVSDILSNQPGDWTERWRVFLATQGYKLEFHSPLRPPKGFSIASVTTDRLYPEGHRKAGENISHAVVMFDDQLVHDPYPLGSTIAKISYYQTLVPLSEAEKILHDMKIKYGSCIHGYKSSCDICE